MDIKYGDGVEFDFDDGGPGQKVPPVTLEKESDLQKIIRQGFRAPVGLSQQMTLTIDGVSYAIFNLSVTGFGIYLNDLKTFELKTELRGMQFTISGQTFEVDGTVVHRSNDGAHNLCGIELTAMNPACQQAIIAYLQQSRSSLFSS